MPAVDDLLAELAGHPPAQPTPVAEIRRRARRRVRRRRALTGVAAVVAVLAVGAATVSAVADDGREDVATGPGATTSAAEAASSSTAPATTEVDRRRDTMSLSPDTDLVDGDVVAITLDQPATGPAVIAQCPSERVFKPDGPLDLASDCAGIVTATANALPEYTVRRTLVIGDGTVDCTGVANRCTLVVRVGGLTATDDRQAFLFFATDVGPVLTPAVAVDGDEGNVRDGDRLFLTFTGVETDDYLMVRQCRTGAPAGLADEGDPRGRQCTGARQVHTIVQTGPETQLEMTAFRDIWVDVDPGPGYELGWVPCEPCVLDISMGANLEVTTEVPLVMEPTDDPIRPIVTLEPDGPLSPGQVVTVRGSGFQPRSRVEVAICPVVPPQGGGSGCSLADGTAAPWVAVADDGTVVQTGFVLPGEQPVNGIDCVGLPLSCAVAVEGSYADLPAFVPLDLTG